NVGRRIALESLAYIHTENLRLTVGQVPEHLRVVSFRIRRKSARQMDGVAQMNLTRRGVGPRSTYLAPNRNRRRILKIKPAENSNGIQGMEDGRLRGICQSVRQIKTLYAGMKIWRVEMNEFGVSARGFRQQVVVGCNHVSDPHIRPIRVPARTNDMALKINRVLVVRCDGKNPDAIAVVNRERLKGFRYLRIAVSFGNVQAQHRLFLVGH